MPSSIDSVRIELYCRTPPGVTELLDSGVGVGPTHCSGVQNRQPKLPKHTIVTKYTVIV